MASIPDCLSGDGVRISRRVQTDSIVLMVKRMAVNHLFLVRVQVESRKTNNWGYRIVAITSGLQPENRVSITLSSTIKCRYGRVVEGGGLQIRREKSPRRFESYYLLQIVY